MPRLAPISIVCMRAVPTRFLPGLHFMPTRGHGAGHERSSGSALCPAPLPTLQFLVYAGSIAASITTRDYRSLHMQKLILETTAPFQGLPELVACDEGLFAK